MREKIAYIAQKLFFQSGTKAVSIDDIAHELSIAKKTIYNFFESKDHIVRYLVDTHIERHHKYIDEIKEKSKNAIDELVMIYRMNCDQHETMKPIFISDIKKLYPECWADLESFVGKVVPNCIRENIFRGQQEGFYRENVNADFISYLYFKSIFLQLEYFAIQKKLSIIDLDREHLYYHVHAIGTTKGIKYLEKIKFEN